MDVIEFVKTANRMCEGTKECGTCLFVGNGCSFCIENSFKEILPEELEKTVSIAEQWLKEHPIKTRKTEFLKMFPNAQFEKDNYSPICPSALDSTWECRRTNCKSCRQDFWNQEV